MLFGEDFELRQRATKMSPRDGMNGRLQIRSRKPNASRHRILVEIVDSNHWIGRRKISLPRERYEDSF
jgi:hypothetical protein